MKNVLVTGGLGYIGAHTCVELLSADFQVVIVDNLSNSRTITLSAIEQITGKKCFLEVGHLQDLSFLETVLKKYHCDAVIHLAGIKSVSESLQFPLRYYDENVISTIQLLKAMQNCAIYNIVFSSSATVYGKPHYLPIDEHHPLEALTPYGQTKIIIESLLQDIYRAAPHQWRMMALRYFNPIGAHATGLIGEFTANTPNNLMPFLLQVALGQKQTLRVFGNDYPTHDGTGVRDYIHVSDLALAHTKALRYLNNAHPQYTTLNLGTGIGYSVLDVINTFEKNTGLSIPYTIESRRTGDVAACYANPASAETTLNWKAKKTLDDMCVDHLKWAKYLLQLNKIPSVT